MSRRLVPLTHDLHGLGLLERWPGGPAVALEAIVLEVAVAGEEMAMVVLREVVLMVLARPQT
jgi:hypothetical protein